MVKIGDVLKQEIADKYNKGTNNLLVVMNSDSADAYMVLCFVDAGKILLGTCEARFFDSTYLNSLKVIGNIIDFKKEREI